MFNTVKGVYIPHPEETKEEYQLFDNRIVLNLKTAWDTFSEETPGECRRYEQDGKDIYDVYEELTKLGMYEAKIVEC